MAELALSIFSDTLENRAKESLVITELKNGSEEAYVWLIEHYYLPIYRLVSKFIKDPENATDTTQEVFIKVYRGIKLFKKDCSLKTWMWRIAVHEASNQHRWWCRHKSQEISLEQSTSASGKYRRRLEDTLADNSVSPFESARQKELQTKVEIALREIKEPYRTTLILRDLKQFSYEEIAEFTNSSLSAVKSRLARGRLELTSQLTTLLSVGQTNTSRRTGSMRKSRDQSFY